MKKIKKTPVILTLILIIAAAVFAAIAGAGMGGITANADYDNSYLYSYHFISYDAEFDIKDDRSMRVTETLQVRFTGIYSTGFIKYVPVNGGEIIKNIDVYEEGQSDNIPYYVYGEQDDNLNNYICIDVGSSSVKTDEVHTYVIEYDYCLTKAQEGKNLLYLNAIGVDRPSYCNIENASVTLRLPEGYREGVYYAGSLNSDISHPVTATEQDGRKVIILNYGPLAYDEGITFQLAFEDGALSTFFDFTPYIFVILGAAVLVILILLKVTVFNKGAITPVVNFEAPEQMDPLLMGKLIDNTVNSEDVTSLIFYWADKGYLKINLDDEKDPVLIRIVRDLPNECADYEKTMFYSLFKSGEMVKTSNLKYTFYKTVERVTARVNSSVKGLYSGKSMGISLLFAVLGGLILGLVPFVMSAVYFSGKFFVFEAFAAIIPAIVVYGFAEAVKFNYLKLSKTKKALFFAGIAVLCAVFSAVYVFLVPGYLLGVAAKIALCVICAAIAVISVLLINRTKEYTEKLNSIVGFREFIRLAEKNKLEKMLKDDPQFYYHVLPYAQVLGVSDIWEEKFAALTVEPPEWMTSSVGTRILQFHVMNSIIRNSFAGMKSAMISKPSSSGASGGGRGGFGGGFGGGHVGGGHGGGGFRGR